MTNQIIKVEKRVKIPPLRKRNAENQLYFRRDEIQAELEALYQLPIAEVAEAAQIPDADTPSYVSSECVLHFVRQSKGNGDSPPYEEMFKVLRQRIVKALPVFEKQLPDDKVGEDPYQREVRDRVVDKVMEMLCIDREGYEERLDYYEVMFNSAVAARRVTAKRDTSERAKRENSEPLVLDAGVADNQDGFDGVLQGLNEPSNEGNSVYRFEVLSAINDLPDDERRVIELLIYGYLLKEVAEIVGCTEKTARTRRNRAQVRLAEVLEREDLI